MSSLLSSQPSLLQLPSSQLSLSQTPQGVQVGVSVPICWVSYRVSAGFPSPAADYTQKSLDLNQYLVRNQPATFMFGVKGDSMLGAGILDGDKVIVDRSLRAKHGDIVVAVLDGEYTIKRLHLQKGKVLLCPENPSYAPIVLKEGAALEVWGVVVGVVRRY